MSGGEFVAVTAVDTGQVALLAAMRMPTTGKASPPNRSACSFSTASSWIASRGEE